MPLLESIRSIAAQIPYPVLLPRKGASIESVRAGEERRICQRPECGRPGGPQAARGSVRLEGQFLCSSACRSSMLRQRVERELFAWRPNRSVTHSHRTPLGLLLLSMGAITKEQLDRALKAQRLAGQGRIGDWLRREGALTEREIARALAMQWSCPVFDLEGYRPQAAGIPRELLKSYRILALPARGGQALFLAFESGIDATACYAIRHITGTCVEAGLAPETAFARAWARALALESDASPTAAVGSGEEILEAAASALRAPDVADARLVRFHRHLWLRVLLRPEAAGHRDYLYLLPERASLLPEAS